MREDLMQWAMSPEAAPFLEAKGVSQSDIMSIMGPQAGGQGYGQMGGDPYGDYLLQLINANQGDSRFQDQMLGYYLDYTNPQNQQGVDENKLNTALSLLSSDDPDMQAWGKALIAESYPQLGGGMGGYGQPQTYEDVLRQDARELIENPSGLNREQFDWNNYIANQATPEQIRAYEQSPRFGKDFNAEGSNPWARILGGAGAGASIGAGLGSVVPGLGTVVGGAAGGTIGGLSGTLNWLLELNKRKEEARKSAAGYSGYSL